MPAWQLCLSHAMLTVPIKSALPQLLESRQKAVYQIYIKPTEDQLESFYTIFQLKDKDVAYLDKGFNKVVVNFELGLKLYISKLHNYLKSDI